jgi:hypothetical protein
MIIWGRFAADPARVFILSRYSCQENFCEIILVAGRHATKRLQKLDR